MTRMIHQFDLYMLIHEYLSGVYKEQMELGLVGGSNFSFHKITFDIRSDQNLRGTYNRLKVNRVTKAGVSYWEIAQTIVGPTFKTIGFGCLIQIYDDGTIVFVDSKKPIQPVDKGFMLGLQTRIEKYIQKHKDDPVIPESNAGVMIEMKDGEVQVHDEREDYDEDISKYWGY